MVSTNWTYPAPKPQQQKKPATPVEVLRRLEWSGRYSYCTGWPCCPICRGIKPGHGICPTHGAPDNTGHRKDCDLAIALLPPNAEMAGRAAVRDD